MNRGKSSAFALIAAVSVTAAGCTSDAGPDSASKERKIQPGAQQNAVAAPELPADCEINYGVTVQGCVDAATATPVDLVGALTTVAGAGVSRGNGPADWSIPYVSLDAVGEEDTASTSLTANQRSMTCDASGGDAANDWTDETSPPPSPPPPTARTTPSATAR